MELKAPPHSIEAEQAVIAAALMQPEVMMDITVSPAEFYRKEHRLIWTAIQNLFTARRGVDVLTVSEELHDSGKLIESGGLGYLSELVMHFQSAANARHYSEIVKGRAVERRLISLGHGLASIGYDAGNTIEKITKAQGMLAEFHSGLTVGDSDEAVSIDDCLRETMVKLQDQWNKPGGMLGLSTGFPDLDRRTGGLRKGDMIIIAGRPSQGKTTLAMNMAEHAALNGKFVIVFSLEMARDSLMQRMLASVGRVDHTRLQSGDLQDDEYTRINNVGARLNGRFLYIDDRTGHTSQQLLPKARRIAHKVNRKPDLVVVDYLQLLQDRGDGEARVSTISRNLKSMARELDCPALILSQLNRNVENRPDKRPLMSDLRDSGSIEQDADLIFMMYRDEYYNENSEHKGLAEVILRKYRNGKIGTNILSSAHLDQCRFESSTVKFIQPQLHLQKAANPYDY